LARGINIISKITNIIGLAVLTLSLAAGQLLFKRVGLAMRGHPLVDGFLVAGRQPALYLALVLYGLSTLLWIWILSRVSLMQAYPWIAISIAFVLLAGWLFFGERVAPIFWIGVALILVGLFLTQLAARAA
jgi:drug/metabolite transporter (DMT)-like permease